MTRRSPKRLRCVRSRFGRLALTDRDVDLLTLVGRCRYVSTEQIAREFFPTSDRARRRIRQLFDARLVAITLLDSRAPNIVSLTADGRDAVLERHPVLEGELRLAGPLRLAGCAHHLACADARLYTAGLARLRGAALTRWSNAGGALHEQLGLKRFHLSPDGLAEIAPTAGIPLYIAVEVDRGTEDLSRVLAGKLTRYRELAETGVVDALWLVVIGGVRRRDAITALVQQSGLASWTRILNYTDIIARPIRDLPATTTTAPSTQSAHSPNTLRTDSADLPEIIGVQTPTPRRWQVSR